MNQDLGNSQTKNMKINKKIWFIAYTILGKMLMSQEIRTMSKKMEDRLVKSVVDVELSVMTVDASMHVDEEQYMLENGESTQHNLWGINLYPFEFGTDQWIEFDSMINIRPWQKNRSRGVECLETQAKIKYIVNKLVQE